MSCRRAVMLLCVCMGWVVMAQFFTINVSASVPRGIYRASAHAAQVTRGTLVLVPRTTIGRSWWQFPWMLMRPLKPVAAVAGDRVCVQPEGVWVNGAPYGAVHTAWRGGSLPVMWGCHVVQGGHVFVASKVPGSLDGRYLGMTRVVDTTTVIPLWLWD